MKFQQILLILKLFCYLQLIITQSNHRKFHYDKSKYGDSPSCFLNPLLVENITASLSSKDIIDAIANDCKDMNVNSDFDSCKVPPVVHLISNGKFHKLHYLSIISMHARIHPDFIFLHYQEDIEDVEGYLQIIKDKIPEFHLVKTRTEHKVFDKDIARGEHVADVLRLESLIRFGGMYFDLDVFVLGDLSIFYNDELSMGIQYRQISFRDGLCNSIMIAKRCSRFLRRWYDTYRDFNNNQWDEFSVHLPLRLFYEDPRFIRVENRKLYNKYPNFDLLTPMDQYSDNILDDIRAIHLFYRTIADDVKEMNEKGKKILFDYLKENIESLIK